MKKTLKPKLCILLSLLMTTIFSLDERQKPVYNKLVF